MNNGFQHKLYHYEETPPARCWEKISEELDSSALSATFPRKLKDTAIQPPEYVWHSISSALDNLDSESVIAAKLQRAAIAPPVSVWQKIETALAAETVPGHPQKKIRPIFKYAAAAALVGLLAWGGSRLLNNKAEEVPQAAQPQQTNPAPVTTILPPEIPGGDIAASSADAAMEEARNDAALEASKKTYARLDVNTVQKKIKNVSAFNFGISSDENDTINKTDKTTDINNRYVVLMTPEGHFIRMSKKLKDMVCCLSGEEADDACLDQLKRWREKILSSRAVHAPGNFADILNLVTSMQDGNK